MNNTNLYDLINLENCRIILVNTTHPGNIGSAARAMKTMGLSELYLVNSNSNIIDDHAIAKASGATDILYNATIVDNLNSAIKNCKYLIATSARPRSLSSIVHTPREASELIVNKYIANNNKIAILFGQERMGLTNDEIDICNAQMIIPTGSEYKSLNLASAVQIISYELRIATDDFYKKIDNNKVVSYNFDDGSDLASADQLELFYKSLEELLIKINFLDQKHPKMLMRRLRKLYNRTQLTEREYNIMRGIITACNQYSDKFSAN